MKAGGCGGTLPAFFSMLAKKTENSSEALAAGLADTQQSRSQAQTWDFKAIQLPRLLQGSPATTGKGKSAVNCGSLKEAPSIIPTASCRAHADDTPGDRISPTPVE